MGTGRAVRWDRSAGLFAVGLSLPGQVVRAATPMILALGPGGFGPCGHSGALAMGLGARRGRFRRRRRQVSARQLFRISAFRVRAGRTAAPSRRRHQLDEPFQLFRISVGGRAGGENLNFCRQPHVALGVSVFREDPTGGNLKTCRALHAVGHDGLCAHHILSTAVATIGKANVFPLLPALL